MTLLGRSFVATLGGNVRLKMQQPDSGLPGGWAADSRLTSVGGLVPTQGHERKHKNVRLLVKAVAVAGAGARSAILESGAQADGRRGGRSKLANDNTRQERNVSLTLSAGVGLFERTKSQTKFDRQRLRRNQKQPQRHAMKLNGYRKSLSLDHPFHIGLAYIQ